MPGRMRPWVPVQQHDRGSGAAAAAMQHDPVEGDIPLPEPGERTDEPLTAQHRTEHPTNPSSD